MKFQIVVFCTLSLAESFFIQNHRVSGCNTVSTTDVTTKHDTLQLYMSSSEETNNKGILKSIKSWFSNILSSTEDKSTMKSSSENAQNNNAESVKNGVLIFGGTGKAGKEIVNKLICNGKTVVIANRQDPSKQNDVLNMLKLDDSSIPFTPSKFNIKYNIDITNEAAIRSEPLFQGINTVISCIGPSRENALYNAENIDYKGNLNLIQASLEYLQDYQKESVYQEITNLHQPSPSSSTQPHPLTKWSNLDDVIMGGRSNSKWEKVDWQGEGSKFARWTGKVITEGGGFCGTVLKDTIIKIDPSYYDGIQLRIRGDGNRYKFRLKNMSPGNGDSKDMVYQASFDTIRNQWITVQLPFDMFYNTRQTTINYSPEKTIHAMKSQLYNIGITYSKFEYNERLNAKFLTKEFALDVDSVQLYRDVRPAFVLISSAGTERVNRLTPQERMKDIPIVQLNPQGILNWKYKAEDALRASGLPYTIIRCSGIIPNTAVNNTRKVEFEQCDVFSGRITRDELSILVNNVLNNPNAVGKTFEVRRDESDSGLLNNPNANWGNQQTINQFNALFRKLVKDDDRVVKGLLPFPYAQDPPAPPTPEQVQAILADPRVKAVQEREKVIKS